MKKILLSLCTIASFGLLTGCNDDAFDDLENTENQINYVYNITFDNGEGESRAVKEAFKDGDKVHVWFEGVTGGYTEFAYDGTEWTATAQGDLGTLHGGKAMAVWTAANETGKTPGATVNYTSTETLIGTATYTVEDGVVTASFTLKQHSEFTKITVTDLPTDDWKLKVVDGANAVPQIDLADLSAAKHIGAEEVWYPATVEDGNYCFFVYTAGATDPTTIQLFNGDEVYEKTFAKTMPAGKAVKLSYTGGWTVGTLGFSTIEELAAASTTTYDAFTENVVFTYYDDKTCTDKDNNSGVKWVKSVTFKNLAFGELKDGSAAMTALAKVIDNHRRRDTSAQFRSSIVVNFENCTFSQSTLTFQVYKVKPVEVTNYNFKNCSFSQEATGQYALTLNLNESSNDKEGTAARGISYSFYGCTINSAGRGVNIIPGTEKEILEATDVKAIFSGNTFTLPQTKDDNNMALQIAGIWDAAGLTAPGSELIEFNNNNVTACCVIRVHTGMSINTTESAKYILAASGNTLAEGTAGAVVKGGSTDETCTAIAAAYNSLGLTGEMEMTWAAFCAANGYNFGMAGTSTDAIVIDGKGKVTITDWVDAWYGGSVTIKGVTFNHGATFTAISNGVAGKFLVENCTFGPCDWNAVVETLQEGNTSYTTDGKRLDNAGGGLCLDIDTKNSPELRIVVRNNTFKGENDIALPRSHPRINDGINLKSRGHAVAINAIAGSGTAKNVEISGNTMTGIRGNCIQLYTFNYPITVKNNTINSWGRNSETGNKTNSDYAIRGTLGATGTLTLSNNYYGMNEEGEKKGVNHIKVDTYAGNTDGTRVAGTYN